MSDTISRQAAIDAINKALDRETLLNSFVRKVAIDAVKELPPAQPECEDAVSREAAIKEAEEWIEAVYFDHEEQRERDAIKNVIGSLRNLPSVTLSTQPGLIPCSERLPYAEYGESDTVLTTCGYRDVEDTSVRWIRLLYFNGGNWCYPTGETYEAKVYAWMPLPKPWEGGRYETD